MGFLGIFGKESYSVACERCHASLKVGRPEVEAGEYACPECGYTNSIPAGVRTQYRAKRAEENRKREEKERKRKEREKRRAARKKEKEKKKAARRRERQEALEERRQSEIARAVESEEKKGGGMSIFGGLLMAFGCIVLFISVPAMTMTFVAGAWGVELGLMLLIGGSILIVLDEIKEELKGKEC